MAYTPIRISTIRSNKTLSFDLFVHFKGQYLKYMDIGKALNDDLLEKLKKQKVARFYILDTHELAYQEFLDALLQETLADSSLALNEKVNLTEGAAETAFEKMQENPGSQVSYQMTQSAAKNLIDLVAQNPDALKDIFGKKSAEDDLVVRHCLRVSALCSKVAHQTKLNETEIQNICTAALLHDLSITKSGEECIKMFLKPYKKLTPEELKIYHDHPTLTANLLKDKPYVNEQVITLIMNHEEKISGSGYPGKKNKLSSAEEVLSLVNCFDKRVSAQNMTHKEAMKDIQVSELGNYNLELVKLLKQVLKSEGLMDE